MSSGLGGEDPVAGVVEDEGYDFEGEREVLVEDGADLKD